MFSTSLIVPIMGKWYDNFKADAIAQGGEAAQNADAIAGSNTFLKVAIMPAILLVLPQVAAIVGREAATRPLAASCLINFLR